MRHLTIRRLVLTLGVLSAGATQAVPMPMFQGLGDLPGDLAGSFAEAISADGTTVVGDSISANGSEAFFWTAAGGIQGLGFLAAGGESFATGVSADGSVIVGQTDSTLGIEAFRWTASNGTMSPLGFLPSGDTFSLARGVSDDGLTVVGNAAHLNIPSGPVGEAFRWTSSSGAMSPLGILTGNFSQATAASADGSVVVGWSGDALEILPVQAYKWTAGTGAVGLPFLRTGISSVAKDVSADGAVIVGASEPGNLFPPRAVRWTDSGVFELGATPEGTFDSAALAASADGSTIVGASFSNTLLDNVAFIWDAAHGMRNLQNVLVNESGLDLTGWTLHKATGVSADGATVVGWGVKSGSDEAWIATVPEPSQALASAAALLGLLAVARLFGAQTPGHS